MSYLPITMVAEWPEKIGTSWWAIGGAISILAFVLVALKGLSIFIDRLDRDQHDD